MSPTWAGAHLRQPPSCHEASTCSRAATRDLGGRSGPTLRGMDYKFELPAPEQMFTVELSNFPHLDTAIPPRGHATERPKHVNWEKCLIVLEHVTTLLATGQPVTTFRINIPGGLTEQEYELLQNWFRPGVGPSSDIGYPSLSDGNRRLSACWQTKPAAILPIHSELCMMYQTAKELGSLPGLARDAAQMLAAPDAQPLLNRAPLHRARLQQLARMSS